MAKKHVPKRDRKPVQLDPELHAQLLLMAKKEDRELTRVVRRILIAALIEAGLWPPATAAGDKQ